MSSTDTRYAEVRALIARLDLCPTEVIARLVNEWSDDELAITAFAANNLVADLVDRAVEEREPAAPMNGDGTGVRF